MIIRPNQNWFIRLFAWHGSVLSKITFRLSLNVLMSIVAVISYRWYEQLGVHLTIAPFSLLGIAIAIFLGFRNNAGYSRFVEARNLWGSLLITERSLLRQIKSLLPDEPAVHQKVAKLLIAFSWSLKHQLRATDPTADLYHNLTSKELAEVIASPMPTNRILLMLGQEIGKLRRQGLLSDITFELLDNKLSELSHALGGCERLASTPVPFAYTPDPAAHRLPVLQPAAFCPGDRPALHDTVCFGVHFPIPSYPGTHWPKSWRILSAYRPTICR